MKLELLKSIITDLHLAGIHDIPANSFMDMEKIESQELVQAVFNTTADTEITAIFNNEEFDESGIANEMAELFAAFGSGTPPDLGDLESIAAKAPAQTKKVERTKPTIIDPRQNRQAATPASSSDLASALQAKTASTVKQNTAVIDFKAEDFIDSKIVDDSKFILLLPYKDEQQLKSKKDFVLLENILKAINTSYEQTSIIFVDDSYKNITQGDTKHIENLAKKLQEAVKLDKQKIILSFGQDCLALANPSVSSIRDANAKVFDVFEDKKLLANYSLSAMVNTPKYKSSTWTNLLLIKRI
jgi:hypothetical protein